MCAQQVMSPGIAHPETSAFYSLLAKGMALRLTQDLGAITATSIFVLPCARHEVESKLLDNTAEYNVTHYRSS